MSGPAQPLPERLRLRLLTLADAALAGLSVHETPVALRPFVRFTPGRRLRLAAPALAVALETDVGFRDAVARRLREAYPQLVEALEAGLVPSAADPVDVATAAYLLRTHGWADLLSALPPELPSRAEGSGSADAEALTRVQDQLRAAKAQARADVDRLRSELATVKTEVTDLRHRLHAARQQAKAAEMRATEAEARADAVRAAAQAEVSRADAEVRRLRERLATSEGERDTVRKLAREGRAGADARVRLLLDVVADAAVGLRRELALPTSELRPADGVEAREPGDALSGIGPRALASDDPAVLDELLALPRVHLVVDGYNVTKSGYGGLSLQAQRERLVTGLGALAARTGAEVTCCFDGAALDAPVIVAKPRGVRVLFSLPGETADELIRRLVAAEPVGRPVVVVSSDKEVASGVTDSGARAVPSMALVRRLERA